MRLLIDGKYTNYGENCVDEVIDMEKFSEIIKDLSINEIYVLVALIRESLVIPMDEEIIRKSFNKGV